MLLFKIVENPKVVGTVINTEENFDIRRIERFSKLKGLLSLIYEVSNLNNAPIHYLLSQIYPKIFYPEIPIRNDNQLLAGIEKIKSEIQFTSFDVYTEFKYFNDFVLSEARLELISKHNSQLPDRFKSHYFFDSLEKCINYYDELPSSKKCTVIEVELLDKKQLAKLDNRLLTTFQNDFIADDFYKQAKDFLSEKKSEDPIFEIIYQGTYKVKSHILDL